MSDATRLEQAQHWQIDRMERVNAYAAVLTHLNAAVAALPEQDGAAPTFAQELGWDTARARGRLSALLQERNPHVEWPS